MTHGKKRECYCLKGKRLIGVIVCGAVFTVCAVLLVMFQSQYTEGDAFYDKLNEQIQISEAESSTGYVLVADTEADAEQNSETQADLLFRENAATLSEQYPDFRGWLFQEGTCINYPIAIGKTNEYYSHRLLNGESNRMGSLFIDCNETGDFNDRNTVIYGHNMRNGSMFHCITDYKDSKVYDARPTMTIYTKDKTYTLDLFAGVVVFADYVSVKIDFESDDDFMEYVKDLKASSTFESDVEVRPEDKLVTLCTCSYEYDNARYALVGKLECKK